MPPIRAFAVGLVLATAGWAAEKQDPCAAESSTGDVRLELALKDHGTVFQAGEIVPLTLSFTASVKGRYTAWMADYDHSGRFNMEHYCVAPEAPDPLESYFKGRGFMGGGLGSIQPLDETPVTANRELNEWRSLPPGHYRVYAISTRVMRPAEQTSVTLRSNTIEIEVGPPDPAWQAEQLRAALATLEGNPSQDEAIHASRVLRFLNTPDAAREMAKLYWGVQQQQPIGSNLMFGLYGSPYRQAAIYALRAEIAVPGHPVTKEFLDTLARLQASVDPGEAMKTAIAATLESLPRKTPGARALTLDGLLAASKDDPALAASVRPALVASWADLPTQTQADLILYRWPAVAGTDMIPILRRILAEPPQPARTQAGMTRDAALKHLYEVDRGAGREAILSDFENPKAEPGVDVVKLLPKEDIAAVVKAAEERIAQGCVRTLEFQLTDRFADASALPTLQAVSEKAIGHWACTTQTAMLRYFLRVSPEYGAQEVNTSMAARKNTGCYRTLLQDLGDQLPKAERSAIAALDDPDKDVAVSALRALSRWGSKDVEPELWERLKRFHAQSNGREDQGMESELMNAIANGANWICPPDKLSSLRDLVSATVLKQHLDGLIEGWNRGTASIGSVWTPEDSPKYSLLQYEILTEDQLLAKIAQLPHDMKLEWVWPFEKSDANEAAYQRVRAAAAANGFLLSTVDR